MIEYVHSISLRNLMLMLAAIPPALHLREALGKIYSNNPCGETDLEGVD